MYLRREEDAAVTFQEIVEGTTFEGYNVWILGFAMVIACIGLTTDSMTAVIGAMLMSPLMGPVIGFSYALGVNDKNLKLACIRSWLFMTSVCLLAAFSFFLISPFDTNTSLLRSYTHATIFDVMLAFFGGMAGFLGIIKKDGTKVIAGVAVATACIPPLCSAAFGLAHGNWLTAVGGMYFYLINTLFIGLATVVFCFITGYRDKTQKHILKRSSKFIWTVVVILMIVPGVYIAYQKWQQEHEDQTANKLTDHERIRQLEKDLHKLDSIVNMKTE